VLVVTASVRGNVGKVYEALGSGALDAVATPRLGLDGRIEGAAELARKIATVQALAADHALIQQGAPPTAPAPIGSTAVGGLRVPPAMVAIGASTGGPHALATLLGALPADLAAAVVVVQHIDALFAGGLARWLAQRTALPITAVTTAAPLRAGTIALAAGDGHLVLRDDLQLAVTAEPAGSLHMPSIDVFFESIARRVGGRGCGVLLTGMGRDGARGLLALRRAGFHTIAQDERTSVVWGMPRAAAEHGAAAEILPIDRIAGRIVAHLRQSE
jgi:chemotaxis response regulator CheB